MDVAFEVPYVVSAILFTLLAIVLASIVFNKKPISASPSKVECDFSKTERTQKAIQTNDLATELIKHKADKVKADEVVTAESNTRIKEKNDSALVTPAENIVAQQEHSGTENVNRSIQVLPDAKKSDVKDSVPDRVDAAVPKAVPVGEVAPQLRHEVADWEAASPFSPMRGAPHAPEAVARTEETPQLLTDEETVPSPVLEEQCVIGSASEEGSCQSLKYAPGKLRTSQLEEMMTKEEREEEQRVQRQQLAAIFQLLKDNKDRFGEVTEGDVEEQLKLYSI